MTGTGGDFAIAHGGGGCGGGGGGCGGGHGGLASGHVESVHFEGGQGFDYHDFNHRGSAHHDRYVSSDKDGYHAAASYDRLRRPDPTRRAPLRTATLGAAPEREASGKSGTTRVSHKRGFPPQHRSDPPQPLRVADTMAIQPPLIASNEAPEALP